MRPEIASRVSVVLAAAVAVALAPMLASGCSDTAAQDDSGASSSGSSSGASSGGTSGSPSTSDAAGGDADGQLKTARACFGPFAPDYDKLSPVIPSSCSGTHNQRIEGVEKVVFLGDSITVGTPPTPEAEFYRTLLTASLKQRFGDSIEVASCAAYGAQVEDLLEKSPQISQCFPSGVEMKRTLIVMTDGGNDVKDWAAARIPAADGVARANDVVAKLKSAVTWLKAPEHFPNGSFVVFGNVYEYTDGTGDLLSCPAAQFGGAQGPWPEGRETIVTLAEGYLRVAIETKTDMVFMLEDFCGRGFRRDDATIACFRGPSTPLWFDFTCIHPSPAGHAELATRFANVIDGR